MPAEQPPPPVPARRRGVVVAVVVLLLVTAGALLAVRATSMTGAGPVPAAWSVRPAPAAPTTPFEVGVVSSTDPGAIRTLAGLGGRVVRAEFTVNTSMAEMERAVAVCAGNGVRLQPLVGWDNGTAAPDLTVVATWAKAFGPGGTYWAGRGDDYAMTDIELGNENASSYKSGDVAKAAYSDLAGEYGRRAVDAARAVRAANPGVGVLVELESGDTEQSTWIDAVLRAGGPDLAEMMRGPVIHAYGPDWREKVARDRSFLRAWGVTKPFYLTEWGISSDDGVALDDNYGYPTDLTYDDAGRELAAALGEMARMPGEIHQVMLYQLTDQRTSGFAPEREYYFGILTLEATAKGGYTAAARSALGDHS